MKTQPLMTLLAAAALAGAAQIGTASAEKIAVDSFGKTPDGADAKLYTLINKNGLRAKICDFGATLVSMEVPDKAGKVADVTHGFDSADGYASAGNPYFGASVGRFGNRIANGVFKLDGKEYTLATNNEPGGIPCHLHGGKVGFNKRMWKAEPDEAKNAIAFTYVSPDREEGYPGTLTTKVTYTLTEANELKWEVEAKTDAPTVLNIVHHSYWNLSGDPTTLINDHILTLNADKYLPTNAGLIPTGKQDPVAGTPMDFTKPTAIGERVDAKFEALKLGGGYDHAWVLKPGNGIKLAARLKDPKSGRVMEISTDKPAVQFYGGNFLDGTVAGKKGVKYAFRTACCLETENFPDAPNQPGFPTAVLKPGETYKHVMIHKFSAE
ncbi:aldose epimerase family protein [Luteolibacter sp. Populi]|uniref:aldose epimerase family protein n=1 Tax=Luteolibacter sp. Populi TaxID=3230487 RepID=UPI003467720D